MKNHFEKKHNRIFGPSRAFLAASDGVKAKIRAPPRLKRLIGETSAALWPRASRHIPFISTYEESFYKVCFPSKAEVPAH